MIIAFDLKRYQSKKKTNLQHLISKWWEVREEILTNNAYDIYEMSPYLMEMHDWLNELDTKKQNHTII